MANIQRDKKNEARISDLSLKELQKRMGALIPLFALYNNSKAASNKSTEDNFADFIRLHGKDFQFDKNSKELNLTLKPTPSEKQWPDWFLDEDHEIEIAINIGEVLKNLPKKVDPRDEGFFVIQSSEPHDSIPPIPIPPPPPPPPSAHSVESVIALLKQKYGNNLQQNNDGDFEINTGTDPGKPVPVTMVKMKKGKVWKVKTDPTERKFKYEDKNLDGTFDSF